jgi:hypothetical protein
MVRLIEKSNDLIGNQTRDLPACSIVPQLTTLPRASSLEVPSYISSSLNYLGNLPPGLRVPTRNIRRFTMFTCSSSYCPSARCFSTANAVCQFTDLLSNSCLSVKSRNWSIFLSVLLFLLFFCFVCFVLCCHIVVFVFVLTCNWPLAVELST